MYSELQKSLPGVPIEAIKHSDFKKLSGCAKAIIRPAEYTPYSNIILVAGAWDLISKPKTDIHYVQGVFYENHFRGHP